LQRTDDVARRLATIPGIGPVGATALTAAVTDPGQFRSGRQFATSRSAASARSERRRPERKAKTLSTSSQPFRYHNPLSVIGLPLSHTIREKAKLLNRVRRLRGQVEAIERALEAEAECADVMNIVVSIRGAANGLLAELMEDHIRVHVSDPARDKDRDRAKGSEMLIEVVRAYLK
jgi:DNA-binding FrmR family transcriptional regulator